MTSWKTGTPAFGDPLLGRAHCVWPLQMLINLPDDALGIREPFIPPGLLMTNMNARKFPYCFLTRRLLCVCVAASPQPPVCLHMTDELVTFLGQLEFETVKVHGPQVADIPTRNKVLASKTFPRQWAQAFRGKCAYQQVGRSVSPGDSSVSEPWRAFPVLLSVLVSFG